MAWVRREAASDEQAVTKKKKPNAEVFIARRWTATGRVGPLQQFKIGYAIT